MDQVHLSKSSGLAKNCKVREYWRESAHFWGATLGQDSHLADFVVKAYVKGTSELTNGSGYEYRSCDY